MLWIDIHVASQGSQAREISVLGEVIDAAKSYGESNTREVQ